MGGCLPRPFATALVPPGIDDQEDKDHQTKKQKHYGPGLVFPELCEAPRDFVEIHAEANLHQFCQNETRLWDGIDRNFGGEPGNTVKAGIIGKQARGRD